MDGFVVGIRLRKYVLQSAGVQNPEHGFENIENWDEFTSRIEGKAVLWERNGESVPLFIYEISGE